MAMTRAAVRRSVVEDGLVTQDDAGEAPVPWWSFTKTLLAATALTLVRDKLVRLDEAIDGQCYSLRQLLQHRAGLACYGGVAAYHKAVAANEEPWPVDRLLEAAAARQLLYPPGEGWAYSNIGYLHIRRIIARLCGGDLDHALQQRLFAPLGIAGPRLATRRGDLLGVAMGEAQTYHPGWVYHGLVVGRLRDAALTLDRLLLSDLLPPSLHAEMLDAHSLAAEVDGRPWRQTGYGLGLMIGTGETGAGVIGHTGGGPGSTIAVYAQAQRRLTIAAFAHGDEAGAVERAAFTA